MINNAIEQCKTEGLIDVFQATKAVRINKPAAITTSVSWLMFQLYCLASPLVHV